MTAFGNCFTLLETKKALYLILSFEPTMASEALEAGVQQAEEAVSKQGDVVRSLKAHLKEGNSQKVPALFQHFIPQKQVQI